MDISVSTAHTVRPERCQREEGHGAKTCSNQEKGNTVMKACDLKGQTSDFSNQRLLWCCISCLVAFGMHCG